MRVLICGSRTWTNEPVVTSVFDDLVAEYGAENLVIIHGAARGADSMASDLAVRRGIVCDPYPARWHDHDKSGPVPCWCRSEAGTCPGAGPRRNQLMLDEGRPSLVIAITDDLTVSWGTRDMTQRALRAGVPVRVVGSTVRYSLHLDQMPLFD